MAHAPELPPQTPSGPQRPDLKVVPAEQVAQPEANNARLIEFPTSPRRALADKPAVPGFRKRVAGAIAAVGVAATLIVGGGEYLASQGAKPDTTPSNPPATDTVKPSDGPSVEISPDHFPLNPKTLANAGLKIEPTAFPVSKDNPYGTELTIIAPTIENVQKNPDGSVLLTVALPGGSPKAYDQNKSYPNYDGSTTEAITYGWDTAGSANTTMKILVAKNFWVSTSTDMKQQSVDWKVGSADWNFTAFRDFNPNIITDVEQHSVNGTLSELPIINTTLITSVSN